jgi:hypothetical protein
VLGWVLRMKNVYILGDSNAKYLVDPFSDEEYFHDIYIEDIHLHVRAFKSFTAYQVNEEVLDSIGFEDNSIVLFYFGYVDIRSYSMRYNNIEVVAKQYVSRIKKYFEGKNILFGFIEPIPSANKEDWISVQPSEIHDWISGSVKERYIEHKKFINIISSENIFIPIIGTVLDSYYLNLSHTEDFNHLNIEYNNLILDYILLKIKDLQAEIK